jgi:glycosyltransferase involved in cell wall biosynthesis
MPKITVVIPAYNAPHDHLERLYRSLLAQTRADFEVVLVDDASREDHYDLLRDSRFRILRREKNQGPAVCRNVGVSEARAARLFFTDTDCALAPDTLEQALRHLESNDATVGDTVTETHTHFGRAVALLGFPGGGCIGFHNVWRISDEGQAASFSTCNVAFNKAVFEEMGRFDEAFPVPGGEDTVLARRMKEAGKHLRYVPEQIVYHVERRGWRNFLRWQVLRGRGNYHIKKHVPEVGSYLRLRLWTFRNSFRAAGVWYAMPVFVLLCASVAGQMCGYWLEKRKFS